MGLDMYLQKRTKGGEIIDDELICWRKANQIRRWLVNHIPEFDEDDDCKSFVLPKELLLNLLADIQKVIDNPECATEVLPTSEGFFFGSTDYDDWYFNQLKQTFKVLPSIIKDTDFDSEEIVYTEWW